MNVYLYDEENVYIGTHECQPSPLEPGVFLFPNTTYTQIEPPETAIYEEAIFDSIENKWSIQQNWVGVPLWNKSDVSVFRITERGIAKSELYTEISPNGILFPKWNGVKWITDLEKEFEQYKSLSRSKCEIWLAPRRHKGFIWEGLSVPADQEAQANFSSVLNLIQLGAPGPFLLRDNNNVDHMLTIAEVQAMTMQMAVFVQQCYQTCWAAKASIDAATTIDQCDEAIAILNEF